MKYLLKRLLLGATTALLLNVSTTWAGPFEDAIAAGKRGDYPYALRIFLPLAAQGYGGAQYNLGVMYERGHGVPQDYAEALRWYRLAAAQGYGGAQFNLGGMYDKGRGVPQDYAEALRWYRLAAAQGVAIAQNNLGVMYGLGHGVPQDYAEALRWYRLAAAQGYPIAQNNLGVMYGNGQGVTQDEPMAYFWFLLASARGSQDAIKGRDIAAQRLTPEQRTSAQIAARNWRPTTTTQAEAQSGSSPPPIGGVEPSRNQLPPVAIQLDSTGSGFRIASGMVVTNHHVIAGCSRLRVNGVTAQVRGSDAISDLALLAAAVPGPATSLRAQRPAVGEQVAVAGYPLRGLLSGFNMTIGNLSSMSGLGGDTRYLQITAPVQLGNSGGPMLDSAGNLMGVVVAKLDAVKTARITGDIPQNVNFAINANVLRSFLDVNSVDYATSSSDKPLPTTVIAERAKGFTVLVECWK